MNTILLTVVRGLLLLHHHVLRALVPLRDSGAAAGLGLGLRVVQQPLVPLPERVADLRDHGLGHGAARAAEGASLLPAAVAVVGVTTLCVLGPGLELGPGVLQHPGVEPAAVLLLLLMVASSPALVVMVGTVVPPAAPSSAPAPALPAVVEASATPTSVISSSSSSTATPAPPASTTSTPVTPPAASVRTTWCYRRLSFLTLVLVAESVPIVLAISFSPLGFKILSFYWRGAELKKSRIVL